MKLIVCFLAVGHLALGKSLSLNQCHRSDPDLNACLLQQSGPLLQQLKNGIPELGIESIDPLHVDFMTAEGDMELIKLKMVMRNMTVFGASQGIFKRIKVDPSSLSGEVLFQFPFLRMTCEYFATGRLFVIPLESSAHFDGNFTDTEVAVSFRLKTIEKKGKEYFTVDKLALKIHLDNAHIKLDSINPAYQQQVNVIQDFFNENFKLVRDTVNPIANESAGELYKYLLESYLRRVPANELLPN